MKKSIVFLIIMLTSCSQTDNFSFVSSQESNPFTSSKMSDESSSINSFLIPWLDSAITYVDKDENFLKIEISDEVKITDLSNTYDALKNVSCNYTMQSNHLTFTCQFYDLVFGENERLAFNFDVFYSEDQKSYLILTKDVLDSVDFCIYEHDLTLYQV